MAGPGELSEHAVVPCFSCAIAGYRRRGNGPAEVVGKAVSAALSERNAGRCAAAARHLLNKREARFRWRLLQDLSGHQIDDPHYRIDLARVGVFFGLPNDAGKHIASLDRELLVLLDPELTL